VVTAAIVIDLDIFKHGAAHLPAGGEAFTVDGFHFQRVEEAFGAGVVITVPLGAHTAEQRMPGQEPLVQSRAILAPPVGMDDDTLGHLSPPQSHLQRLADQVGGHPFGKRPADDQPGIEVDDHGQVEPPLFGPEIGDIAHPLLVGGRGAEVLLQQVRRHRQIVLRIRGGLELLGRFGPQILPFHAGRHGLAVIAMPSFGQIARKTRRPFAFLGGLKSLLNLLVETITPLLSRRRLLPPLEPTIVAAARSDEHPAHRRDFELA